MTYQGSSGKLKRSPSMNSLSNTNKDNGNENCIEISDSIITNNEINQDDNEQLENSTIFNSILQFLPDKYIDEENLLKEKDNFSTINQDIHILDNALLIEIQRFLYSNQDLDYVLDVINSVLINNKNIPFCHLKDCFGYDFKENIKEHIHLASTREKLVIFNKNLLIKNIQFLDSQTYNNIKELQEKQPTDLLNIFFELNKKKYPNKSVLNHLENTLNSIICMPEVEIDFLTNILPDIDIPHSDLEKLVKTRYNNQFVKSQVLMEKLVKLNRILLMKNIQSLDPGEYDNIKKSQEKQPTDLLNIIFKLNKNKYPNKSVLNYLENTLNSVICMPEVEIDFLTNILPDINIPHSDLEKLVKTRYNNQSVKSQVPMEKLVKLNRILLMKNIVEIQEKNITDKNKIIDYETLNLLSDKELECIKTDLVAKIKKVQTIKKNYFENFPVLQEATINKSMPDKTQEIDKTPIISSIKQLSQYATDTEYKLTGHTDKKDCFNDNVLKQLSVDTLQQINNNLLICKFMEQEYRRLLTSENSNYINTYNNLLYTISTLKEEKLSNISFI